LGGLDFTQILVQFTILIASLTFHEAAHAWTANQLGDPTARLLGRLTLNPAVHIDPIGTVVFPLVAMITGFPLIGWAKPVPVDMRHLRHPRRDFAIVAIAGPISNLLLATVGALVFRAVVDPESAQASDMLANGLFLFVMLNVLLAVFNMIPIPPLDGGNVLMGVLPESMAAMVEQLRPWGFLLIYALMLTGVLSMIIAPVFRFVQTVLL
jgi:Zn-dependent protease